MTKVGYAEKTVYVYEQWSKDVPLFMGELTMRQSRSGEVFSFEYDKEWLQNNRINILDPSLAFFGGPQYTFGNRNQFGIFMDSSPDRWGRMLMKRRAKAIGDTTATLHEIDYLLGVEDFSRMGALRFSLEKGGDFVSNNPYMATPPIARLRDLEFASSEYEKEENFLNQKWIKLLLAPGSSLGGARPKANVIDTDRSLWIAKFPSKNDEFDIGAWEYVVHELAKMCGLHVPDAKLMRYSERGSTFLVKRFDREGERRIHFASAMTLLNRTDGESNECSYLDIADFIKSFGIDVKEDLCELWKRIVFGIAVRNTDDHLRNHGFLLKNNAWKLSPMYDVNPCPDGTGLSLNITEDDNRLDFSLASETADCYGIARKNGEEIIRFICETIRNNWRKIAKQNKISEKSITYMASAFENAETCF